MIDEPLILTLVLARDGDRLLLGRKKRGFGQGKWNGFGGKVEAGETIETAARREFNEETGAKVSELLAVGRLSFTFANGLRELEVHVFSTDQIKGKIGETEEMAPKWFKLNAIPYDDMWADDEHWLPLFLAGRRFAGSFHYADEQVILHHSVIVIDDLVPPSNGKEKQLVTAGAKGAKKRIVKSRSIH